MDDQNNVKLCNIIDGNSNSAMNSIIGLFTFDNKNFLRLEDLLMIGVAPNFFQIFLQL